MTPLRRDTLLLLSDLAVGAIARIHDANVDSATSRFLRAIGLTRTAEFRLCKAGEPCIIQVRSTRIGLSRAIAGRIVVAPVRHDEE
jgi:Fe2+ transport system protein FeoA